MLRADYRGEGRLSTYQKLALFGIVYAIGLGLVLPPVTGVTPEISAGIAALWNPLVIVTLQLLWAVLFIVTGWSMVTGGVLSFHVHRDRVLAPDNPDTANSRRPSKFASFETTPENPSPRRCAPAREAPPQDGRKTLGSITRYRPP